MNTIATIETMSLTPKDVNMVKLSRRTISECQYLSKLYEDTTSPSNIMFKSVTFYDSGEYFILFRANYQ